MFMFKTASRMMITVTGICLLTVSLAQTGSSSSSGSQQNSSSSSSSSSSSNSSIPGQNVPGPIRVDPNTPDPITLFKAGNQSQGKTTGSKQYNYRQYTGDPTRTRIYTLDNGLKVYLSQNKVEPRIQTYIAVRAGSNNDPRETTGLAHYLEHMLFKGTNNIGTTNWEREQMVLTGISQLYEKHRKETDPEKKKQIYAEIDKLSQEAAKFSIPNEYDKMISSLGAKGTNAYTSKEQTVYVNDIPANELEKWLVVESERFRTCVLRLFHTELEAVYEEYNMSRDRDGTKLFETYYKALFPTTPYGTQTTIGEGEHLKNPSMVNIMGYFYTFYVPGNMAICLSGDIDYDATIAMVDKYFGNYFNKPVDMQRFTSEKPILEVQRREVWGLEAETMTMGWRLPGANTEESLLGQLVAGMLYNQQAGLMDLDLNQKQLVLDAAAYHTEWRDYSVLSMSADPREGQSLEDCEKLMLAEIEKLRTGDFEPWLMEAVVNDLKLSRTRSFQNNSGRASAFVTAFIRDIDWGTYINKYEMMSKFTKQDVIAFVNEYLESDNYVVVYKRKGEDKNVQKVEKPAITPVEANREAQSKFLTDFMELPSERVQPEFLEYKKLISSSGLNNDVPFSYIRNNENDLFELYYILDMGSDHDQQLALAVNYLPFLGTDKYSAGDIQKEFFKLGLSFDVFAGNDRLYVSLSGLEANLEKGVALLEHLLANTVADNKAYKEYVDGILKTRDDNKSSKTAIFNSAMATYAMYGAKNPQTNILSEQQLRNILPAELVAKIKSITGFKHQVFYYGMKDQDAVKAILNTHHITKAPLSDYPERAVYPELDTKENKILFVHYPMVQAQVMFFSKDMNFDKTIMPEARLFNEYFGSGLSSIVFQEIRETKALAYSAYVNYSSPAETDKAHYVRAGISTQADKMQASIEAMLEIMNNMPQAEEQFQASIDATLKQLESERITRSGIFWNYESARRRGLSYDVRRDIYMDVRGMSMQDMQNFFNDHISDRHFTIIVMGNRTKIDINYLKTMGTFKEMTLEEIFGY